MDGNSLQLFPSPGYLGVFMDLDLWIDLQPIALAACVREEAKPITEWRTIRDVEIAQLHSDSE